VSFWITQKMALNKWITRIDVSFFRSTGTCQKIGLLSHYRAENEKYSSTQMLILLSLVTSTCYHRLTLVLPIAYSLTPTRKLNGKTRVHTVFFSALVFHFGYSLSYFRHAPLVFDSCPRARKKLEYRVVHI
jgi:hypothetical protein